MSEIENTTDPLELARQAKAAGIAKMREARERHLASEAELATKAAVDRAEYEALSQEFGAAEAEEERLERLATADAHVADTSADYRSAADVAAKASDDVDKAVQALADALARAVPAEQDRLVAGEAWKAAHRELEGIAPGRASAPSVPAKRLLGDDLEAVRKIAIDVHPELREALDRLTHFQGWTPPQFAMVGGREVRIN